jgi:DNA-binding beta-propeller fold protein YncE
VWLLVLPARGLAAPVLLNTLSIGDGLSGVGINSTTNRIYVASESSNAVFAVEGGTHTVTGPTDVEGSPRYVDANPAIDRVYATQYASKSVAVISGASTSVVSRVRLDGNPLGVEASSATNRVYVATVADRDRNGTFSGLSVIDGTPEGPDENSVIATVPLANEPKAVGVNDTTDRIYVTNRDGTVAVVDGESNSLVTVIGVPNPLGLDPTDGVGVDPNTDRIYVSHPATDSVSVIDGAPGSPTENSVVATVSVGDSPSAVDVSPALDRAYVANSGDKTISVISGTTGGVVATAVLPQLPGDLGAGEGLGVNESTNRLYVTHHQANELYVLEDQPREPTLTGTVPESPANDNSPRIRGSVEEDSTVRLYATDDCSGAAVATGSGSELASPGLEVAVADDSTTTFHATATDRAGNSSDCSASSITYTEDSTAPGKPTLTDTDPDSPGNDNSPLVKGTAEASATVEIYTTSDCSGAAAGIGSGSELASPGLEVSVADDSTTTFRAAATDRAGNSSGCSASSIAYTEDSTPPSAPTLTDTDPDSPANDNSPVVKGTAEASATVRLFTTSDCSRQSVTSGSGGAFASPGLLVYSVPDDSSTTFRATARDRAGNSSGCSSSSITYTEVSTPADPHATWSSLGTISWTNASSPQVVQAPDGDAVFVWERTDGTTQCSGSACLRIQVRSRSLPRANLSDPYSPPLSDPGENARSPQVALVPNGDAVFVWARPDGTTQCSGSSCSRVQARIRSAAGTLGPVETLSAEGQHAHAPRVAIAPNGDAVFVWERFDGTKRCSGSSCSRIQTRVRTATGSLSAVETLSQAREHAHAPQLGVGRQGDAVFVWERFDGTNQCSGSSCSRIQASVRSATGTLSSVQTLSAEGQHAHAPEVAITPNGDAVLAWQRFDGSAGCGGSGCSRIETRARAATTGLYSAVQTLSGGGLNARAPQVGVDSRGDAVFVWEQFDATSQCSGSGCSRIQARTRTATGSLGTVQTLSDAGQHARAPKVGVDARGSAAFVWQRFDGKNTRIQARSRSATGALGTVHTLSEPGSDASSPAISVDPDGGLDDDNPDAIAVWRRSGGTAARPCCFRIQAAEQTVASSAADRFDSSSWELSMSWTHGTLIADFNGDGLEDFLLSRHHITEADHILLQQPGGTFVRGFTLPAADRHGCDAGDVNGDGLRDIFCMRGANKGSGTKRNELWIARANGIYVDEAGLWGVIEPYGRGRHPVLFDFNGDGRLDLYTTNRTEDGPRSDGQRNENILYLNAGGRFAEHHVTATGPHGSSCADAGDWNGDGHQDLLVCGPNLRLFQNAAGQDTQVADQLLGSEQVAKPRHATLSDVNGDGRLDLIIVRAVGLQIRLNLGGGARFSRVHARVPLADGMAAAVGDVTGDQVKDVYVVQGFAKGRNAEDLLLEGPGWLPVDVPHAYQGYGSTAEVIRIAGRPMVLVTNGHYANGPVQFIGLRDGSN